MASLLISVALFGVGFSARYYYRTQAFEQLSTHRGDTIGPFDSVRIGGARVSGAQMQAVNELLSFGNSTGNTGQTTYRPAETGAPADVQGNPFFNQ